MVKVLIMSWFELLGASALYILGLFVTVVIAIAVGARFGNGKGADGLVYVIYPPILILLIGCIVGVFLLVRALT
jgi:hypothetical protein